MWAVTTQEFWVAVGEYFLLARQRKRLKPSHLQALGGPHYDTVTFIERGQIGNVAPLDGYAKALGLDLVDIFREILKADVEPLTPEAKQLLRKFESATVVGRQALVAMAAALPEETPSAPSGLRDAAAETPRDTKPGDVVVHGRRRRR